jgi:hypothetical protein
MARGNSSFEASYKGIGQMLNSDFIQDAMVDRAEKIKAYALSISPTSSGEYRTKFKIYRNRGFVAGGVRAYARLYNEAPYAAAIEYGTRRNPRGQRILGRAMAVRF